MGKVLIIDDEKQILGLLSRIIGLEGYDVFQASGQVLNNWNNTPPKSSCATSACPTAAALNLYAN